MVSRWSPFATLFRAARLGPRRQPVVSGRKNLQVKARRDVPLAAGLPPGFRSLLTIAVFVRHVVMPFYIAQPGTDQGVLGRRLKRPATYNGIQAGPSQRGKWPRAGGQRSAPPRVGGPPSRRRSETLSPPMVPHSGSQAATPASGKVLRQAQRRDGVWLFGGPFAACTRGPTITLRKSASHFRVARAVHRTRRGDAQRRCSVTKRAHSCDACSAL